MKTKKIDVCKFALDSGRLVFYPGETMVGKLHLEMNRAMDMEAIEIQCKGKLQAEWEQKYDDEDGNEQVREYKSKDKIFEMKQKVFGSGREEHPAGEYDYPFSFQLPQKLPSSFEGENGFIRYHLKVVIKKSWKKDLKLKKMFVVNEHIDINASNYDVAPGDEDQKTLGCLCCASGPLTLSASLNRSGFCGGQSIFVNATVGNNTSREMDDLSATLMQQVDYEAKLKDGFGNLNLKRDVNKIASIKCDKIKEGETFTWKSKEMALPPIVPNIKTKHITVTYYVEVHLDVPMGIDMTFKLPVTIGTIPYLPIYQEAETKENKHEAKCPGKIGLPPVQILGHESMKPFQYSQLLKAKPKKLNKDEKEFQNNEYVPLYTFSMPAKEGTGSRSNSPADESKDNMPPIQ